VDGKVRFHKPVDLFLGALDWALSSAKDETAQFVAQLLDLLGIAGCAEAFGQLKECLLFLLSGLDALLDQFYEEAVVTGRALFDHCFYLLARSRVSVTDERPRRAWTRHSEE
jgi:hypothetical protein